MKIQTFTASAANTTGSAGSEGLSEALLSLLNFLKSEARKDIKDNAPLLWSGTTPEAELFRLRHAKEQALVIVEDGHVHVGLLSPYFLPALQPRLLDAKEVGVGYEYGAAYIYTAHSDQPLLRNDASMTAWDFVQEHPSEITKFSLYVLRDGQLAEICTRPAKGFYSEETD